MKIFIASDHAGVLFKKKLLEILGSEFELVDLGPADEKNSVDYPDFAEKVCEAVLKNKALGLLACGSGIGMSISANKINGIRAAQVNEPVSAKLAREHNDANVLCMGARFIAPEYAAELVRAFINAKPSTDARHKNRLEKIRRLEQNK